MPNLAALTFASPALLFALLALPGIFLLLRATPPVPLRVRFPAFVILRELRTPEETPERTPWWLLLLRLLLAALAILGLAGPMLNAPQAASGTGPLVFVVDDSWAAAARWRLRQDALKAGAEEAAAGDRLFFLMTTAEPQPSEPFTPMTGADARVRSDSLKPKPFRADRVGARAAIAQLETALRGKGVAEIRWLADGLGEEGDRAFAEALGKLGALTVFEDDAPVIALRPAPATAEARRYIVERLAADDAWSGDIVATARDGRELARAQAAMPPGAFEAVVDIALPLALRNETAVVALRDHPSAGTVQLVDARERRALIGMIAGTEGRGDELTQGAYYVRKALIPYAEFLDAPLEELLQSQASAMILDDVGRLRPSDVEALTAWIEKGGVAIRFAGPNLADAAQDADPPLLPVKLRGGGRSFGGALTWETPQKLAAYAPDGPFGDLVAPPDVFIREQVLAVPGGETSERSWASLADGTPIVTGVRMGAGALALFHTPATPSWSDLPISSAFVEMLRKLVYLSILGPERDEVEAAARLAPIRTLDGYGRFERPPPDAPSISAADAAKAAAPERRPGFYGAPDAPLAVNAVTLADRLAPLDIGAAKVAPYVADPPLRFGPAILAIALLLLVIDAIASLILSGKLRPAAAALALVLAPLAGGDRARAGPLDAPIDVKVEDAALKTRLAFVRTGDPEVDRIAERGLKGLTEELIRRTAIEPAAPVAVDPQTDDLSVYPLLYWPIVAGATAPSEEALANIENFMRYGGLIVFDTRDDERAVAGAETPERAALKDILGQLDIPPLTPLPKDHVLTRSFYLKVEDLPGRTRGEPVWVQAEGSANDGVTPLVIGGRDWASAWAVDDLGRPLRPMSGRGSCSNDAITVQECAFRAGINIAMVAYTGNYKADQVHTPILLKRLER